MHASIWAGEHYFTCSSLCSSWRGWTWTERTPHTRVTESSPKIEAMYSTLIDLGNREIINVKQVKVGKTLDRSLD